MLKNPFNTLTPLNEIDPVQNKKPVEAILETEAVKKCAEMGTARMKNWPFKSDNTLETVVICTKSVVFTGGHL